MEERRLNSQVNSWTRWLSGPIIVWLSSASSSLSTETPGLLVLRKSVVCFTLFGKCWEDIKTALSEMLWVPSRLGQVMTAFRALTSANGHGTHLQLRHIRWKSSPHPFPLSLVWKRRPCSPIIKTGSIWALTTMGGERGNEVANIWTVESVFSCLSRWDEWGVQYVCLFGFHAWATKWTVAPLIQKEEQVWRVLANVSVTHKTWGMRLS